MNVNSRRLLSLVVVAVLVAVLATVALAQAPDDHKLTRTEIRNLQASQEMLEALNAHDYDRVASMLDKKYISTGPMELSSDFSEKREGAVYGQTENIDFLEACDQALSEPTFGVDQSLASGNFVIQRWWARGKHVGEFLGIPPSNRTVEFRGISITEFRNGKQVRSWVAYDTAHLLQQMGVPLVPRPVNQGRRPE